ncbi:MAG: ROK family protein [Gammaproteobacteria bacterium]|nr:ROK family protein [Gammaproteobacteria bacterium]NNK98828.1 ROK family protein [Xanthomonadales bacterium]
MQILGIDIGGSGIKGALVDLDSGEFASDRVRIETPASFEIEAVTETIATLVNEFDYEGPVGIGFPAAVANGIVLTAPTAHHVPGWVKQSVNERFSNATGHKITVLNDADAAGLAEMRFGAGRGVNGVVITVTLGTGVGGGLFMDGNLVPNLEIGKIFLESHDDVAEQYMAGRIKKEHGLKWFEYGERLNEFCLHIEHIFSPQLIIIGGGVSKKHKKFLSEDQLKRTRIVPAKLRNQAGIVGAAIWAAENE